MHPCLPACRSKLRQTSSPTEYMQPLFRVVSWPDTSCFQADPGAPVFLFAGWPAEAYLLIGRDDIAATVAAAMPAADASAAGKARSAPGPEVATPQWPGTTPHQMAPLGRTPFRQPNLSSSIPGAPWEPPEKLSLVFNFAVEPLEPTLKGRPLQALLSQHSYAAKPLQGIFAAKLALRLS